LTRPTARVLALLELLQAGGQHTVASLADRLEVDERTLRRYASHLVDLGIPIDVTRGLFTDGSVNRSGGDRPTPPRPTPAPDFPHDRPTVEGGTRGYDVPDDRPTERFTAP